jgi:hypothetical protein
MWISCSEWSTIANNCYQYHYRTEQSRYSFANWTLQVSQALFSGWIGIICKTNGLLWIPFLVFDTRRAQKWNSLNLLLNKKTLLTEEIKGFINSIHGMKMAHLQNQTSSKVEKTFYNVSESWKKNKWHYFSSHNYKDWHI